MIYDPLSEVAFEVLEIKGGRIESDGFVKFPLKGS